MDSNKVCAVVVTYNIGKKYIENFNSLYGQVDKIIIVDNGSDEETVEVLQELQKKYNKNVEVIFNNENLGIGAAQNIGIKKAMEENFDWVLLLDHDSKLPPNMVMDMIEQYSKFPETEKKRIGMIAPNIYDVTLKKHLNYIMWQDGKFNRIKCDPKYNTAIKNVISIIASGSMIKSEVFKKIGLVKEEYFIDQIDFEYNIRMLDNGFNNVVLCNVVLCHSVGKQEQKINIFGWNLVKTDYTPSRYYYIFRNKILLIKDCKLFKKEKIKYLPFIFAVLSGRLLGMLLYEKNKIEKLYFIFKGLYDGLKGRYGKL
jgi:rhamnosyltransferase